jgi:hypothetical protein
MFLNSLPNILYIVMPITPDVFIDSSGVYFIIELISQRYLIFLLTEYLNRSKLLLTNFV